ncbi:hypothetical protein Tco_0046248 [Tanacetum coccineum]
MYNQEVALNLQAQLQGELEEEEERLIRQKEEEDNIALIESWDNTQAMMDTDYQMAQQLQAKEQEHLKLDEGSEKIAEDSTKRAGTELEQEVAKKQKIDDDKVDDDQEEARMKELMNIVPDEEEVAVDPIPLATKPSCIVDWKIIKEEKISQFQIIRADGSSKRYSAFIHMLRNFTEKIWKICGNWRKLSMGQWNG